MKSVLTCNGRNVKDDVLTKVLFQTSIPLPFNVVGKSENRKSLVRSVGVCGNFLIGRASVQSRFHVIWYVCM